MTKKVLFALAFAAMMLPVSLRAQDPDPDPEPVAFADTLWFEDFSDSTAWANSGWTIEPDSAVTLYTMYNFLIIGNAPSATIETQAIEIPEGSSYSLVCDIDGLSQGAAYGYFGGWSIQIYDVEDLVSENTELGGGLTTPEETGHKVYSLADWAGKTVKVVFKFANDEVGASLFGISEVAIRTTNKPIYDINAITPAFVGQIYDLSAIHIEGDETNVTYAWTSAIGTIGNDSDSSTSIMYEQSGIDTITLTVTNDYDTYTAVKYVRAVTWSDIVAGCETPVDGYPYVQDFEDQNNFDCMKIFDGDGDGDNWSILGGKVHSGSYCATSASFDNDKGALTPDNWLILPPFVLPEDVTDFTLSWWAIAQDSNWTHENYSVYVTTDPETFGTNPIYTGEPTGRYTKQSFSLEAFAGQTIYVAFRHHDCTDMFRLNIDDIVVGNTVGIQSAENAANVAIFPNPVCNMLNVEGENVKSVEVIDMNGRVVLTNDRAGKLDMSEVAEGVYMVRVMSLSGITTQKIIKK